ncbi:MAG: biotin synthase BioB [Planctomycetaceae bacterium]|nr:biotin synthase BioB [Planctomycetaceae bacterium]
MNQQIASIGRRSLSGQPLDRAALTVLSALWQDNLHDLLYWANQVRTSRFGRAVRLCSIVAGKTGRCSEDCKWCAQSARYKTQCPSHVTGGEEIVDAAKTAHRRGACHIGVVNSGRHPTAADMQAVIKAAAEILSPSGAAIRCCAALGELTPQQAQELAAAGIVRYNHNLETSRRMFAQVVTTHTYDDRLATLAAARAAGMELCCGGIFGLGETWDDRVELALTLRDEVRPQVSPLNFLHPIPGTPLGGRTPMSPSEILATIAIFRLAMPDVDLKIAGGRELNLRDLQSWMFYAGGTSCLVGDYLTTKGRGADEDLKMIADLGLVVVDELPPRVE